MTKKTDPIVDILEDCGPLPSFEILAELLHRCKTVGFIGRNAGSKRLERLFKKGKVARYITLERGAHLYYIPRVHSQKLVRNVAKKFAVVHSRSLARVLSILDGEKGVKASKILSIDELGRIVNLRSYLKGGQRNPKLEELILRIEKLGIRREGSFLFSTIVDRSEFSRLRARYDAAMHEEAYLLALAKRVLINKKRAEQITQYRRPNSSSFARNKFDMFGQGGWINKINIIVECMLRRGVTKADLEGYNSRIGGTIGKSTKRKGAKYRSPIARYYIANQFSDEAKLFAARKGKGIRLLYAEPLLNYVLCDVQRYDKEMRVRPIYFGRFKELEGKAFEAEIQPVFSQLGYDRVERRKKFYKDNGRITDIGYDKVKGPRKDFTDVDLFCKKNYANEVLLVECKESREGKKISRKKLFTKIEKYEQIAGFLQKEYKANVKILVIGNANRLDQKELLLKYGNMIFETPREFYDINKVFLVGATKWLFGF